MKTWKLALAMLVALISSHIAAPANIVGYINRSMQPGYNLIADQLLQTPDNTINVTLTGNTPNGAMFTKWNGSDFLPLSIYNALTAAWSINYTLNLGEGAVLWTPTSFTVTFVGEVGPYFIETGNLPWLPNYPAGLHLISDPIPRAGNLSTMFTNVVGRPPVAHESVWLFDEATQAYSRSKFDGTTWDTDAMLAVGQAAWFDIGGTGQTPPVIPEPSTAALLSLAALAFGRHRVAEFADNEA